MEGHGEEPQDSTEHPDLADIRHEYGYMEEELEASARETKLAAAAEIVESLKDLPEELGFAEGPSLDALRARVVEIGRVGGEVAKLAEAYRIQAEIEVGKLVGDAYLRAQIGFAVRMALIWQAAGELDLFAEDLSDAYFYAYNARLDEVAVLLEQAIQLYNEA